MQPGGKNVSENRQVVDILGPKDEGSVIYRNVRMRGYGKLMIPRWGNEFP